jgi:hypothetical protein
LKEFAKEMPKEMPKNNFAQLFDFYIFLSNGPEDRCQKLGNLIREVRKNGAI